MSKMWEFLIGTRAIADALGVSTSTLYEWQKHDFPVTRLPDSHKRWATSTTLIDQWLKELRQTQRAGGNNPDISSYKRSNHEYENSEPKAKLRPHLLPIHPHKKGTLPFL